MKKHSRNNKKILIASVIIVAVVLIGAAGGAVWFFLSGQDGKKTAEPEAADPVVAQEEYESMQEEVVTDSDDPMQRKIDFKALQEINPDVYAWISIPGTNIDYPVLQSATEADDYYLNTTIDGKHGYPGSIYTEKYNSTTFADPDIRNQYSESGP